MRLPPLPFSRGALRTLLPTPPLPRHFLFGVATADHQCEAYEPAYEDIRDVWERWRQLVPRQRATDFWHRYAEDVALARELGCTTFRFSIAWSRVEPTPGALNQGALDHYRRLIETVREAGMEPIVTLHHFTWPVHVEERGGMIAEDFPATFAHYAHEVASRIGRDVRYWITINEPTQLLYGYIKPWWERRYFCPPGLPEGATLRDQTRAIGRLIPNLFRAHALARDEIRRVNPDAQVGANPLVLGLPAPLRWIGDVSATRVRGQRDLDRQGGRFAERALLDRGDVDVAIAAIAVTPERARHVAFSESYYRAGLRLLVRADRPEPPDALAGRGVAVVRGTAAERDVHDALPRARVRFVDDYPTALRRLDAGQVDAVIGDDILLQGLIEEYGGRYALFGPLLAHEIFAAAMALGDRELFDAVDATVRHFKASGEWAASYERHIGEPVPDPPPIGVRALDSISGADVVREARRRLLETPGPLPLAPPGTGLRRVQDRGVLRVAVRDDLPGLGRREPSTGEYGGLEIDLARAIARRIFGDSTRLELRPARLRGRIPLLSALRRLAEPWLKEYGILSTVFTSNWWHLGMAGRLSEFLCPAYCVGKQDFVGLDYYWGFAGLSWQRLQRLMDAAAGRFDRAPVWPGALYDVLAYHHRLFPGKPILIVENGSVAVADGVDRPTYLRQHVREVQRAVRDGIPVIGYGCWAITSNREWGLPFGDHSDFGLYYVDLDNDPDLRRVPTPSAETYRQIIATRGVHERHGMPW